MVIGSPSTHHLFAEVVPCGHKPTAVEVGMRMKSLKSTEVYPIVECIWSQTLVPVEGF